MKKFDLFFKAILVPLDFILLLLAGLLAYFIRFQSFVTEIRPVVYELPLKEYLNIVIFMALLWLIIFSIEGLYSIKGPRKIIPEMVKVFFACSTGLILIIILIFLKRELFSSRFIILAAWLLSIILVTLGRILIRIIKIILLKYGVGTKKIILVGKNSVTSALKKEIENKPTLGYKIIGQFSDVNETILKQISKLIEENKAEEILQSDPHLEKEKTLDLIDLANEFHIDFRYASDLFNTQAINIDVTTIAGVPIVEFKKTTLEGWGRIYKRIFDIICSLIFIIITSPIMLLAAIAIKLDSRGPVFYLNERVGENGKIFNTLKFRTMKIEHCTGFKYDKTGEAAKLEAELIKKYSQRVGPLYKVLRDPRRTNFGHFLEKTSLDEIPQFFNVLIGNMSLVGPRPHQPREVALYKKHHKIVLGIRPGVTGLAQISGRSDLDFEDEVKLDTYYIKNWSMLMDIAIILKTPFAVLKTRKFA